MPAKNSTVTTHNIKVVPWEFNAIKGNESDTRIIDNELDIHLGDRICFKEYDNEGDITGMRVKAKVTGIRGLDVVDYSTITFKIVEPPIKKG